MYLFFEVFRHSLRTEEGAKIRFENIFFDLEKYKKFLNFSFFSVGFHWYNDDKTKIVVGILLGASKTFLAPSLF